MRRICIILVIANHHLAWVGYYVRHNYYYLLLLLLLLLFIIIIISCQLAIASKPVDEVVHKAQVVNVIIHVS